MVTEEISGKVVTVLSRRGVVGVRADTNVCRRTTIRLLGGLERVGGSAGVGREIEGGRSTVREADHGMLPISDVVPKLDSKDLQMKVSVHFNDTTQPAAVSHPSSMIVGVEVEEECIKNIAWLVDQDNRHWRTAQAIRIGLPYHRRNPVRLVRDVVFGCEEDITAEAGNVLRRHGRRDARGVDLGNNMLKVDRDVGRPPLLLGIEVCQGRVCKHERRDRICPLLHPYGGRSYRQRQEERREGLKGETNHGSDCAGIDTDARASSRYALVYICTLFMDALHGSRQCRPSRHPGCDACAWSVRLPVRDAS